jgi:hypothetical protein
MKLSRALLLTLLLAGCASPSRGPITFLIETDRPLGVREVARIARVLGSYKQLTPTEMAHATIRLRRAINDLVEIEYQRLKREAASPPCAKSTVRPSKPAPLVAKALPRDLRAEARANVLSRLGTELALPMLNAENRSVVMFGSLSNGQIDLTPTAYEIDHVAGQALPVGGQIARKDGIRATLVQPMK